MYCPLLQPSLLYMTLHAFGEFSTPLLSNVFRMEFDVQCFTKALDSGWLKVKKAAARLLLFTRRSFKTGVLTDSFQNFMVRLASFSEDPFWAFCWASKAAPRMKQKAWLRARKSSEMNQRDLRLGPGACMVNRSFGKAELLLRNQKVFLLLVIT